MLPATLELFRTLHVLWRIGVQLGANLASFERGTTTYAGCVDITLIGGRGELAGDLVRGVALCGHILVFNHLEHGLPIYCVGMGKDSIFHNSLGSHLVAVHAVQLRRLHFE